MAATFKRVNLGPTDPVPPQQHTADDQICIKPESWAILPSAL